tara:strand:- start:10087 stop:11298 length:1212 start_codon:yes stop_codon:yes gene_type:complete
MFVRIVDGWTTTGDSELNGVLETTSNSATFLPVKNSYYVTVPVPMQKKGKRVFSDDVENFEFLEEYDGETITLQSKAMKDAKKAQAQKTAIAEAVGEACDDTSYELAYRNSETEEEALERIEQSFDILRDIAWSVCEGDVSSMIISGPAGIGKSHLVNAVAKDYYRFLCTNGMFLSGDHTATNPFGSEERTYRVIKGTITPIALYQELFQYRDKGQVLVFDDCDTLFYDDVSLNILKAALDTDHKRTISWMAESRILEEEGVPRQFDFCGSVIFISNLDFDRVRSVRIKPHLDALKSRSLYYDLEIGTVEDKIRRIKSLVSTGLFEKNRLELSDDMKQEIVDFLNVYMHDLDEVSIRTALKIGGLARRNPNAWKKSAVYSLMRREAKFRFLLEEKKANKGAEA